MADTYDTPQGVDPLSPGAVPMQERGQLEGRRHELQTSAADVRRMADEIREQGKELATEYYQQGREKVLEWQEQVRTQVHEKPMQSLLIAGGIGLLLGLLRRR